MLNVIDSVSCGTTASCCCFKFVSTFFSPARVLLTSTTWRWIPCTRLSTCPTPAVEKCTGWRPWVSRETRSGIWRWLREPATSASPSTRATVGKGAKPQLPPSTTPEVGSPLHLCFVIFDQYLNKRKAYLKMRWSFTHIEHAQTIAHQWEQSFLSKEAFPIFKDWIFFPLPKCSPFVESFRESLHAKCTVAINLCWCESSLGN